MFSILLSVTLIPLFIREFVQKKKVTIILYHNLKPEQADKHFKILKSKYNIISLKDYIKKRKLGKDNLPSKSLIITFDDGYKSVYQLKSILKKYKIHVTIFLCSRIVGTNRHFWWDYDIDKNKREYLKNIPDKKRLEILRKLGFEEEKEFEDRQTLSKDEIEEMKNIVDFQSHTMFHPILPNCNTERAYEEISQSKIDLENNYGLKIYALSYPNGNYSEREITIVKEVGYECAVTVDLGFNSENTDLFRLKRICIDDVAGVDELLVTVSGLWDFLLDFKNKAIRKYMLDRQKDI